MTMNVKVQYCKRRSSQRTRLTRSAKLAKCFGALTRFSDGCDATFKSTDPAPSPTFTLLSRPRKIWNPLAKSPRWQRKARRALKQDLHATPRWIRLSSLSRRRAGTLWKSLAKSPHLQDEQRRTWSITPTCHRKSSACFGTPRCRHSRTNLIVPEYISRDGPWASPNRAREIGDNAYIRSRMSWSSKIRMWASLSSLTAVVLCPSRSDADL